MTTPRSPPSAPAQWKARGRPAPLTSSYTTTRDTTTENALTWTRSETPDVALLDFKLADGFCTEIARSLLRRGVPVVCYSGYSRGTGTPPELRDVTWIAKPVNLAKLRDVLVNLVSVAIAMNANEPHHRH
jgi:ActR/RegA family two-component response regulator